jgi:hypothetical protein
MLRQLVEQDHVLLLFQTLGTPPNIAIQGYLNENKYLSYLWLQAPADGTTQKNFPWTIGWQPNYQVEAQIYARYNGRTDKGSGEDQGFSTALANGIDPINVFPIGPDNDNRSRENNYSPLWDAHVSMWTQAAIDAGKVHRIHSMDEQKSLIAKGYSPALRSIRRGQAILISVVYGRPRRSSIACALFLLVGT